NTLVTAVEPNQGREASNVIRPVLGTLPHFPPFLLSALQSQDPQLKSHLKTKLKTALVQALFDHLFHITMYPSHKQYVLLLSSLVMNYPFLREKIGSGYDALHESLRNKFKKERRPLVDIAEVNKMREKFRFLNSGRKNSMDLSGQEAVTLQKICRQLTAAILLLPSLLKEDSSTLFVIDQPMLTDDLNLDVSLALGAVFSLYYIFGIEYPKQTRKTMSFLEAFVFKLNTSKTVPICLKRLYNAVSACV
ncbi:hypothetical protein HHUSO_G7826, partial [Huso huso]